MKRYLALLLTAVMLLGMIPAVNVAAADASVSFFETFDELQPGTAFAAPFANANLATIVASKGNNSTNGVHLNDTSTTSFAQLRASVAPSEALDISFDLKGAGGAMQFYIGSGIRNNANSAYWIRVSGQNVQYYSGSAWVTIKTRSVYLTTWSAVRVVADVNTAKIYINGEYMGEAQRLAGSYGSNVSTTLDSITFVAGGAADANANFFIDNVKMSPTTPASINENVEGMTVNATPLFPFADANMATVVVDASTNGTNVVHLKDTSANSSAQLRAMVKSATALDVEFDVRGVSGAVQLYITSGARSTANTAYLLQLSGKTVQYYDGSAWKTLKTRSQYITTWTTVRVVATLETAEIFVNGELMGIAPRTGGSYGSAVTNTIDSISFCCGSAASATNQNFYLDNVKVSAVTDTINESFEELALDTSFGNMFLNAGMATIADLDGNKAAFLEDTSTTAAANLRAVVKPGAAWAVEFDVLPVNGAVQLYITSGARSTANTAYWLQISGTLVRYYSGTAWVTIKTMAAPLSTTEWSTVRVETTMTEARAYINGQYMGKLQRAGGSYGTAVTDTINSISFIAGGNADANVKYYVDNVKMAPYTHTHSYGEGVVTTEPGCETEGVKTFTCSCGDSYTEPVAATGHSYDEGVVTTEPGCETEGAKTFTCSCGHSYTEPVAATGHSYDEGVVTTEPGCETEGVKTFTCSCGHSHTEPVDALGHDIVNHDAKAPTCDENGWEAYETCSRCDYSTYVEIKATGHSYDEGVVTTEPTCTDAGVKTFTCSCGHSYTEPVAATGHSYDEGVVTTEPDCETEGVKTFTCSCGHSYTEPVDALGHDIVNHDAKAPTCTEIGWEAYETCSRCAYSTYVEIKATGHSYTETVVPPTFDADGYTVYTCACGDSYTVTDEGSQKIAVATVGDERFETLAAAIAAAEGNTVVLQANIELDAPVVIAAGKTVTLDLNGKSLVYNSTVINEAMISNYGDLTINDSVGTGEIFYNYTGANDPAYFKGNYTISNAGTLTVNGGKIHIANLRAHAKYPINNNSTTGNAVLVINGGHLYNYNTAAIRQFCNSTTYQNSVTINGGVIEGYSAIWVQNPGAYTVNGQLSITGGEIKTTAAAYVNGTAELKDVASKIYFSTEGGAWDAASSVSITGGIINENVYLAANAPASINVEGEAQFNGRVELPVVLTGIEVTALPEKVKYIASVEELDLTGAKLTLTYSNGTTEVIDITEAAGFDNTVAGIQTLTVSYEGFTATFEVEVYEKACDVKITWITGNATAIENKTTVFAVTAANAAAYQWQFSADGESWADFANENAATRRISFKAVAAYDNYLFRCRITDASGVSTYTAAMLLDVQVSELGFSQQPEDQKLPLNSTATFTAKMEGGVGNIYYQWYYLKPGATNWAVTTLSGYNTDTLSVTVYNSRNGYQFKCVMKDSSGAEVESAPATLEVMDKNSNFAEQPADVTIARGEIAVFTATAQNVVEPVKYRWYISKDGGETWFGTSTYSDTLAIEAEAFRNGYMFRCVVTDATGHTVISDSATLTVTR